jgi:hypothetical protein
MEVQPYFFFFIQNGRNDIGRNDIRDDVRMSDFDTL